MHTLILPAAWRQVSSILIHLAHSRVHAARDLHVTVSAQSKCLSVSSRPLLRVRSTHSSADFAHSQSACGMAAGFDYRESSGVYTAHNRNESSARCLCSARVNLSCWQAKKKKDHERVDWLAFEIDPQRDVCVLLGPSGLAHVRSVLSAVSSVRDPVVKR